MRSQLSDAALHKDSDLVSVAGGRDAMGDEDRSSSLHDTGESLENALLGVGIDGGQSVVEDENAWIADDGPGDGRALFLAAGEGDSALANHGVEAARELEDLGADVGDGCRLFDLLVGGLRGSKGDVVADGLGEEEGLLRDKADVGAKLREGKERMGALSMRTMPGSASCRRAMRETRLDFPEPVGPTIAREDPAGMLRLMSWRMVGPPG